MEAALKPHPSPGRTRAVPGGAGGKKWTMPLIFAAAAVSQGVHVFTSEAGFLAGFAFGVMLVGLIVSASDYLYSRGRGPAALYKDGEDRGE